MSLLQVQELLVGSIDFKGQSQAQVVLKKLLNFFSVSAFCLGFLYQNIYVTLAIFAIGLVVTALFIVPPYSYLNKDNLKLLPPKNSKLESASISETVIDIN